MPTLLSCGEQSRDKDNKDEYCYENVIFYFLIDQAHLV